MSLPLVTIVTPSYNQADYLEFTIQSVLAQEYPNLEYIIVDGGSEDGSLEIIQKYTDRLAWWVSEPDRGQADAINKGLSKARGEVVAWLNSDDLYLPNAINAGVAALTADPALGMVFGNAVTIDAQGRPLNPLAFGDWDLSDLLRFRIICQPAVFMRRQVLEQAGFLDEHFHFMLDHHLWLRMGLKAPIRHVDQIWAAARHHPSAKNVSLAPQFSRETYRLLEVLKVTPGFDTRYRQDQRKISGGAHRLAARYYLDGGQNWNALQAYIKALWYWPSFALRHGHRMAFAAASLLGLDRWIDRRKLSQRQPPDLSQRPLQNWPGIDLS